MSNRIVPVILQTFSSGRNHLSLHFALVAGSGQFRDQCRQIVEVRVAVTDEKDTSNACGSLALTRAASQLSGRENCQYER